MNNLYCLTAIMHRLRWNKYSCYLQRKNYLIMLDVLNTNVDKNNSFRYQQIC